MPPRGRPPKPIEVKRRLGNPGQRPLPKSSVALTPVGDHAVTQFATGADMVRHVLDNGGNTWISATDAPTLEMARQLWDMWLKIGEPAYMLVDRGRTYLGITKELRACLSSLGLDPIARSRLGVAEVKVRTKLEELQERHESRAGRRAS